MKRFRWIAAPLALGLLTGLLAGCATWMEGSLLPLEGDAAARPAAAGAAEIVVDDPQAQVTGSLASTTRCGHGGGTRWALTRSGTARGELRWQTALQPGSYEVFAYVPYCYSTTGSARYVIAHAGGETAVALDQAKAAQGWHALGRYTFGAQGSVTLSSRTGEARSLRIAFDAVKWVGFLIGPVGNPLVSIAGRVAGAGGAGLGGVTLRLSNGATATTDPNGDYVFPNLAVGSYTLTPVKAGYRFSPTTRVVNARANATGQHFSGTASATSGFSISGRVTTPEGAPVSGLSLTLNGGSATTTDALGNYTFAKLASGTTYTVKPEDARYRFGPGSRKVIAAASVDYPVNGMDFTATLRPTSVSISGRVATPDGAGLSGVTLSAGAGLSTSTDSNGHYTLAGLTPWTAYTVTPSKAGYRFSPSARTTTTGSDVTGRDFVANSTAFSLSGRVVDAGGAGVAGVTLSLSNGQTLVTGADGTYRFANLTGGVYYTLIPSKPGAVFSPATRYVKAYSDVSGQDFVRTGTASSAGE